MTKEALSLKVISVCLECLARISHKGVTFGRDLWHLGEI